jgi:hypothetical protein
MKTSPYGDIWTYEKLKTAGPDAKDEAEVNAIVRSVAARYLQVV